MAKSAGIFHQGNPALLCHRLTQHEDGGRQLLVLVNRPTSFLAPKKSLHSQQLCSLTDDDLMTCSIPISGLKVEHTYNHNTFTLAFSCNVLLTKRNESVCTS